MQGCHRPARPLQLLAVAVAAAAVPPVVGRVSVHLHVFPPRVHVLPRQGHSMSQGLRRTLKSLTDYQLCYCVPTTSPQKVQTFRNILSPTTKEGLKISQGLSRQEQTGAGHPRHLAQPKHQLFPSPFHTSCPPSSATEPLCCYYLLSEEGRDLGGSILMAGSHSPGGSTMTSSRNSSMPAIRS